MPHNNQLTSPSASSQDNNLFAVLFVIVAFLLNSNFIYSETKSNSCHTDHNIVVGFLTPEKETYQYKLVGFQNMSEIFNNFGVKVVLIDYNKIINLKEIEKESFSLAKQDETLARKLISGRIRIIIEDFIKTNGINRIFIPGNHYNLYSNPFPPTPHHQLVTEAIVKIVDDNPAIHLLGICDGLQGIMHANEVKVTHIANLIDDENDQQSHLKSTPNPQCEEIPLQQIRIVPNSHLAQIVSKFLTPDENGWFSVCFPDVHSGAIDNTLENRKKLELLGYKIVGFSNDGVIEVIEDKYGNIHFRNHPEMLVVGSDKDIFRSTQEERRIATLAAIAIINDFLYRLYSPKA